MKVQLKNVGKKYEGREDFTLRHIDLEIEDKDFCVILGPSGCGKTTLLRMIAGLNSITEGDLIFDEKRVNKVPPKDRDIAMVFQSYALYPHMSVYDNMAFSLAMRREPKKLIHQRVMEVAEVLKLTDYLYSKPSDISGGQRQRVALGRAMVRKPKVFLMDEPLSNLDAKLREHMRVELVRLHQNLGTTSIYVTHDQTEAMTMATKIILLDKGQIQQVGQPEDFYDRPANMFVAKFIGSPTMNIFKGKIEGGKFISEESQLSVTPSEEQKLQLKSYEGKAVYMGIRSERFLTEELEENTFWCHLDVVELLGKERTVHATLDSGKEVILSLPGHLKYQSGARHQFAFDTEALHFFDCDTEERI